MMRIIGMDQRQHHTCTDFILNSEKGVSKYNVRRSTCIYIGNNMLCLVKSISDTSYFIGVDFDKRLFLKKKTLLFHVNQDHFHVHFRRLNDIQTLYVIRPHIQTNRPIIKYCSHCFGPIRNFQVTGETISGSLKDPQWLLFVTERSLRLCTYLSALNHSLAPPCKQNLSTVLLLSSRIHTKYRLSPSVQRILIVHFFSPPLAQVQKNLPDIHVKSKVNFGRGIEY